jgi:hypothetical protein
MTLVLDRSGSMENNGGADAMPGAVTSFINFFDDNNDRVALATFASHARVDVTMRQPFKQPIINAVNAIFPSQVEGGTFSQGGLTNGLVLNNSVVTLPGENVVRVCVFFTDGLANIIRDSLYCRGVSNPPTDWNFGGFDSGSTVGFFNPTNGVENTGCRTSGGNPTCCSAVSGFRSAISGTTRSFTRANVTADAEYRAVQVANDMRAAGMIVYSIGLGSNINRDFLQQIANDPDLPGHVGTPYDGEAVFAPTAADLRAVFEIIAAKIRLRLTR